jgi:RNA polymerase sigma factor (sigma-70 family)
MAAEHDPLRRHIRRLVAAHLVAADLPDPLLLERFASRQEEAAFAALVRRHGPLVWGVCWRLLRQRQDAEDAFQATFLVLARKAGSLRRPEALGAWLHGVATRTALKARSGAARRRACEREAAALAAGPADDAVWRDLRRLLDEAVAGLPEKYRVPFVLCYLEGRTVTEVAERLGWPRGTVATRLAWARARLRARLARRGLALSAAVLTAALARGSAPAAVPAWLTWTTAEAARNLATSGVAMGGASAPAVALAKGVCNAMVLTKGKVGVAVLLLASAVGTGVGVALHGMPGGPREDILVQVREQRTGSLVFGVGVNSDAGLTGSIVLNERNFDVRRAPTSLDDLFRGRAFRGAGQEFRLEPCPGLSPGRGPG